MAHPCHDYLGSRLEEGRSVGISIVARKEGKEKCQVPVKWKPTAKWHKENDVKFLIPTPYCPQITSFCLYLCFCLSLYI